MNPHCRDPAPCAGLQSLIEREGARIGKVDFPSCAITTQRAPEGRAVE